MGVVNWSTLFIAVSSLTIAGVVSVVVRRARFWDRLTEILDDPSLSDEERAAMIEAHWANDPF